MRHGFLGSIAALAVGAGLAWGQGGGMPGMPYPGSGNPSARPELLPVVGGSPVLAPGSTVPPSQGVGTDGPGYPPPAPFGLNDPSMGGGAPEGRVAPRG